MPLPRGRADIALSGS